MSAGPRTPIPTSSAGTAGNPWQSDLQRSRQSCNRFSLPLYPVVPAPGPAPVATPKRKWNWLGILSLILGILSWVILTGLLAIGAILLGIVALAWFRKATGRIGISALAGILLGIAAIAANLVLA